jgi:hypothetical protein
LEGRHARIACAACHSTTHPGLAPLPTGRPLGSAGIAVRPDAECGSCHVDPHAGRYSAGGAAAALAGAGCRSCHTAQAWRPSSVDFDAHARFSFALEGAHRAVPCVACHNEMKGPPASATLVRAAAGVAHLPFAVARTRTCESCHDSPHGTQFETRRGGAACATCHSTDAFVPASKFDHDRDAAFKLAGAHAQVACARCHRSVASSIGGSRVLYRPLGTKCEDCHTARPPESSRTERSRGNGAPHGTLRLSGVTR